MVGNQTCFCCVQVGDNWDRRVVTVVDKKRNKIPF